MWILALIALGFFAYMAYDFLRVNSLDTAVADAFFAASSETQAVLGITLCLVIGFIILQGTTYRAAKKDREIAQKEAGSLADDLLELRAKRTEPYDDPIAELARMMGRPIPTSRVFDQGEESEDVLKTLGTSIEELETQLGTVRREFGDDDRVQELSERLGRLRTLHSEAMRRFESIESLQEETDRLQQRLTSAFEKVDIDDLEAKVDEIADFVREKRDVVERAATLAQSLPAHTTRLKNLDEQSRKMIDGESGIMAQVRAAERTTAVVKGRIEQLAGRQGDQQRGVAAIPPIGQRISTLAQEVATIERDMDKLDTDTGIQRVNSLGTRLEALRVQLTGHNSPPVQRQQLAVVPAAAE